MYNNTKKLRKRAKNRNKIYHSRLISKAINLNKLKEVMRKFNKSIQIYRAIRQPNSIKNNKNKSKVIPQPTQAIKIHNQKHMLH